MTRRGTKHPTVCGQACHAVAVSRSDREPQGDAEVEQAWRLAELDAGHGDVAEPEPELAVVAAVVQRDECLEAQVGQHEQRVVEPRDERAIREVAQRREAERAYEAGRRDARRDERRYGVSEERCRNVTIEETDRWGRTEVRRVRRCD